MSDLNERSFAESLDRIFATNNLAGQPEHIVVGVSGGADSMALAMLAAGWAAERNTRLTALTIDHGLRDGSEREAAQVGEWMKAREIAHRVISWHPGSVSTGIQEKARKARLDLLTGWCRDHGMAVLMLAHHKEDQAETMLQRISRNSGPDGMSGMRDMTFRRGIAVIRPLIGFHKEDLQQHCAMQNQTWLEDPSNQESRFERVRHRAILPALARKGLSSDALARLAATMARLRDWMDAETDRELGQAIQYSPFGFARIDLARFHVASDVKAIRALARTLTIIGGREYPVRSNRLAALFRELRSGAIPRGRTFGGCIIRPDRDTLQICREADGCSTQRLSPRTTWTRWDQRFEIRAKGLPKDSEVSALGLAGWQSLRKHQPDITEAVRTSGIPHEARLALPAIRSGSHGLDVPPLLPHFYPADTKRPGDSHISVEIAFVPGYLPFSAGSRSIIVESKEAGQ